MIRGTRELANEILGLETRVGSPKKRGSGLWEEVSDPKYATGVGLVLYGLDPKMMKTVTQDGEARCLSGAASYSGRSSSSWGRIVERMKGWFDEL